MGSRKNPQRGETIVTEETPKAARTGLTIERRRQRIVEGLEKLDDEGILRVDWFVKAILEDDPVLMSLAFRAGGRRAGDRRGTSRGRGGGGRDRGHPARGGPTAMVG